MKTLAAALAAGGAGGLGWSVGGTPLLARLLGRVPAPPVAGPAPSVEILVAAFNEQAVIGATLESLVAAARAYPEGTTVTIRVGLDHCTDGTADEVARVAAQAPAGVVLHAVPNSGARGKWNVLDLLIRSATADWVALVDCGSVWHPGLLAAAGPLMADASVLGVAPAYAPSRSGALERLNWRLERYLKNAENSLGGPVSVHGATVLYRRTRLLRALDALAPGAPWFNDDVALPLTLRFQNPGERLAYLAGEDWVRDLGVSPDLEVEFRRRRRMVVGNMQVVRGILIPRALVLLIASRRVFRLLWAYWILAMAAGVGLGLALLANEASGVRQMVLLLSTEMLLGSAAWLLLGGLLFSNWIRRLAVAFGSGLFVLKEWGRSSSHGVSWN